MIRTKRHLKHVPLLLTFLFCAVSVLTCSVLAASIKPELKSIDSTTLGKKVHFYLYLPAGYDPTKHYPVLYLLHGTPGSYKDWHEKSRLSSLLSDFNMIAVLPDGANSWFLDSPRVANSLYDTHVTKELIPYVDANYSTVAKSYGRGICGLSSGGYAAVLMAVNHPELFGCASSISGLMDIERNTGNGELRKHFGFYFLNANLWKKHNLLAIFKDGKFPSGLKLLISCGTNDTHLSENRDIHKALQDLGIPHGYIEGVGNHSWEYFDASISAHLKFHEVSMREE